MPPTIALPSTGFFLKDPPALGSRDQEANFGRWLAGKLEEIDGALTEFLGGEEGLKILSRD